MSAAKQKMPLKNQFGLANPQVDTVRERVRQLQTANSNVRLVFERFNKIAGITTSRDPTQLEAFTRTIVKLIRTEIEHYRNIFRTGQLPVAAQELKEESLRYMELVLDKVLLNSRNDSVARTNKIALFFAAIGIEKAISDVLLPPRPQQSRRYADDDTVMPLDDTSIELRSPKFKGARATVIFFTEHLRDNLARMCDGANDTIDSIDIFALRCINNFHECMPAYLPDELGEHIAQ